MFEGRNNKTDLKFSKEILKFVRFLITILF